MREILFRGKQEGNGEWVYGLLTIMWGQYHIIDLNDENIAYPIDPSTIGQYTGSTDKNGTKIFEGDICEIDREEDKFEIIWDNSEARFSFVSTELYFDFSHFYPNDIKVVSNIHDNPELLEVKK